MKKILIIFILSIISFSVQDNNDIQENNENLKIENVNQEINEIDDVNLKEIKEIKQLNQNIENRVQQILNDENKINEYDDENFILNFDSKQNDKIEKAYGVYIPTTDSLLDSKNFTKLHPLASLTKIMTAVVVLDEVKKGKITLKDTIKMTKEIANIGGSKIITTANTIYTVEELLEALLVYSANNAAYALASYVGRGEIYEFVFKMNQKAFELHMDDTVYHTPAGLPTSFTGEELDISTVKDQIILVEYAMNMPELMRIANLEKISIKKNNKIKLVYKNRNKILHKDGNIGLKTGFHNGAGYNMAGVYDNNGVKSIIITFGDETDMSRFEHQLELHKIVDNNIVEVINKNKFDAKITLVGANKDSVKIYILEDFYYIKDIPLEMSVLLYKEQYTELKKGEEIGKLVIKSKDKIIKEIPIYSSEDTKKAIDKKLIFVPIALFLLVIITIITVIYYRKLKRS